MILPPEVNRINVHPTIIRPIIRQSHNKLDPRLLRGTHNFIKRLEVNHRLPILPPLEDNLRRAGALTAVLRESALNVCHVFVVEAPCAEDVEAGVFGGG
jgi:hypothetical protein